MIAAFPGRAVGGIVDRRAPCARDRGGRRSFIRTSAGLTHARGHLWPQRSANASAARVSPQNATRPPGATRSTSSSAAKIADLVSRFAVSARVVSGRGGRARRSTSTKGGQDSQWNKPIRDHVTTARGALLRARGRGRARRTTAGGASRRPRTGAAAQAERAAARRARPQRTSRRERQSRAEREQRERERARVSGWGPTESQKNRAKSDRCAQSARRRRRAVVDG